jgi:hypothetical protein
MGSSEGRVSFGFDGFRFWVLSSVGFSSGDHRKSDLRWSIPLPVLQLSLSLFFSSLGSLGLRREERRKNRKGEERRREGRIRKGKGSYYSLKIPL